MLYPTYMYFLQCSFMMVNNVFFAIYELFFIWVLFRHQCFVSVLVLLKCMATRTLSQFYYILQLVRVSRPAIKEQKYVLDLYYLHNYIFSHRTTLKQDYDIHIGISFLPCLHYKLPYPPAGRQSDFHKIGSKFWSTFWN